MMLALLVATAVSQLTIQAQPPNAVALGFCILSLVALSALTVAAVRRNAHLYCRLVWVAMVVYGVAAVMAVFPSTSAILQHWTGPDAQGLSVGFVLSFLHVCFVVALIKYAIVLDMDRKDKAEDNATTDATKAQETA